MGWNENHWAFSWNVKARFYTAFNPGILSEAPIFFHSFASKLGLMWFCSHPSPGIYQALVKRQLISETSFKPNDTTLWAGRKGTFTESAHWGTWIKCIILQLYLQNNKPLLIPSNCIYEEVQSNPRWKFLVLDLRGIRAIRNMTWPPAFYQFSTLMLICVRKA